MPLYEFRCLDCGNTFEERRPFSQSDKKTDCVQCTSERTIKLLGSVTVLSGNSLPMPNISPVPTNGFGGCCGGGCGCQH